MPSPAHGGERPRSHRRVARRRRLLLAGLRPRPPALCHGLPARNPRMAEARRDAQLHRVAGPLPRPSPPGSPAAQQLRLLAGLRAPAPARARSRLAGPRPHLVEPPRVVRRRWVAGPLPRPSLLGSPAARRWRLTGPCLRLGGRRESEGDRRLCLEEDVGEGRG